MERLYYAFVESNGREYPLIVSDQGLVYVGGDQENLEDLQDWVNTYRREAILEKYDEKTSCYQKQLSEYFIGERKVFKLPLDQKGTSFQLKVWSALRTIPYGKTVTYSDIAKQINKPKAVRAVGTAIGKNPISIIVPCHRVIGKNGKLTGYGNGLPMKKRLLALEGVFIEY